ncbi:MAG: thioredoxin domain-containing protein [Chloroflexota bacterium]
MGIFSFLTGKQKNYSQVIEVDDHSFKQQVFQRSYKYPVMVDFWASYCVPCRRFTPVLERVAMAPESGFVLAKLNTEVNIKTASRMGIRSVPSVKIFRNGKVVGEFVGSRLESQVRDIMQGMVAASPPKPSLKISDQLSQRYKQGVSYLRKGKGFEATICLRAFPEGVLQNDAQQLLPLAQFLWDLDDGDGWTGKKPIDTLYEDALIAMEERNPKEALEKMTEAHKQVRKEEKAMVEAVISSLEYFLDRS